MWCSAVGCILTLTLSLLAALRAAEAQPTGKVPRLGVIMHSVPPGASGDELDVFRQGLRALGYVEGQTVTLEVRWGEHQHERFPALAAELVQQPVDLIVAAGASPARAAQHATTMIPIVMLVGIDPVAQGLVASLAHPGGNLPGLSQVALLVDAGNPHRQAHLHAHAAAARALGLPLLPLKVRGPDEFAGAFQAATQGQAQALIMPESALFFTQRARLAELALASRLPTMSGAAGDAAAGGLMDYGPDLPGSFRRVAVYVDKILKGAQPAALPVEQPTKFALVIHLKTAKALGITPPPSLLLLADEVIQ
jgi:putative tryptophan/tyrosine transport system substrate-binding protein